MQEMQKTWVWSLGQEDPLKEARATHSRILAWEIPWIESGGLQSTGSQRVGHNWVTEHACTAKDIFYIPNWLQGKTKEKKNIHDLWKLYEI